MRVFSEALSPYAKGLKGRETPFLEYVDLSGKGEIRRKIWTREEFWQLSRRAAFVLVRNGLGRGDHFVNGFGRNRVEDLAFRLGAAMVGSIPVTINWQADTLEQMAYKIETSESRLVLHDASFDPERREALRTLFPRIPRYDVERVEEEALLPEPEFCPDLGKGDVRTVIFTSGTTGRPKGVELTYGNYENNAEALGGRLLGLRQEAKASVLVVNPLHHTNSSAVCDCFMRFPSGRVILFSRYGTSYWAVLAEAASRKRDERLFAFTVARHFDFLEQLFQERALPVPEDTLRKAMARVDFVIGSAPVGPTTVQRLEKWTGKIPMVRFGSTETTFQVSGVDLDMPQENRREAFERGWNHLPHSGYFIGRPHPPFTELKVVRAVDRGVPGFMEECGEGEPGYLISRGGSVMKGYLKDEKASTRVLVDGWYLGFRDIGFFLENKADGLRDYYWVERDSALLIRGGANASCEAVASELSRFIHDRYGLAFTEFDLAVVGLRLESEHEDACCVTVELKTPTAEAMRDELQTTFLAEARATVSKGAKPDRLRFGPIPRTFKGSLQIGELKKFWTEAIRGEG
ncbi:MAG: acyl--CoA ligase [Synergistaceae bacterium]|jgi:acyl-CoA synthetase (AMP-forming)/AMP-acid ligase II|nr:acyl--CoA ligase [Synergistaceae bacterium]